MKIRVTCTVDQEVMKAIKALKTAQGYDASINVSRVLEAALKDMLRTERRVYKCPQCGITVLEQ